MKKTVVAILLLVFLASCGKDSVFIKARFSVLGDSYSAFEGYVDPDSNKVWWGFPTIGVTGPELMWWSLVPPKIKITSGFPRLFMRRMYECSL